MLNHEIPHYGAYKPEVHQMNPPLIWDLLRAADAAETAAGASSAASLNAAVTLGLKVGAHIIAHAGSAASTTARAPGDNSACGSGTDGVFDIHGEDGGGEQKSEHKGDSGLHFREIGWVRRSWRWEKWVRKVSGGVGKR